MGAFDRLATRDQSEGCGTLMDLGQSPAACIWILDPQVLRLAAWSFAIDLPTRRGDEPWMLPERPPILRAGAEGENAEASRLQAARMAPARMLLYMT